MKYVLFCLLFGIAALGTPAMATEEPPFTLVLHEGHFEVRDYAALVVAEVTVTGDQKESAKKDFACSPATFSAAIRSGRASR